MSDNKNDKPAFIYGNAIFSNLDIVDKTRTKSLYTKYAHTDEIYKVLNPYSVVSTTGIQYIPEYITGGLIKRTLYSLDLVDTLPSASSIISKLKSNTVLYANSSFNCIIENISSTNKLTITYDGSISINGGPVDIFPNEIVTFVFILDNITAGTEHISVYIVRSGIDLGYVIGPSSSITNTIPIYGSLDGKVIKNSNITIENIGGTDTITVNGKITGLNDPINLSDAANKSYVDNLLVGLRWKNPAIVATTGNISLFGLQTIDGVSLNSGDRVLVKDQTNKIENGVYIVSVLSWDRASDIPDGYQTSGIAMFVSDGIVGSGYGYVCDNDTGSDTIGVDEINFVLFNAVGSGDVVGPSSSTTNSVVIFQDNLGKTIKSSNIIIDNSSDKISGVKIISLYGDTSGVLDIKPNSATTNYSLTLPSSQGTTGSYIKNDGSGNLSWIDTVVETSTTSITDNTITRFDGTSGKIIQSTGVTIDDLDNIITTGTITTPTVTGLSDPINGTDAVSKNYSTGLIHDFGYKESVVAATTGTIIIDGLQTIDGVSVSPGDRILVKDQIDPIENGIYLASSTAWLRSSDFSTGQNVSGSVINISKGIINKKYTYICTSSVGLDIVGTNGLTFEGIGLSTTNTTVADNTITRFDGTTGRILQSSGVTIDDLDNIITTGTITTPTVTGLDNPVNNSDASNKNYVDNEIINISWKEPVKVATNSNITLSGLSTQIDGITLSEGDRVLVKNQTSSVNNGIYLASSAAWTRSADCSTGFSVSGIIVYVQNGSTNSKLVYICSNSSGLDIVGINLLTFQKYGNLSVSNYGVDNAIVRFDGVTGNIVQTSGITIDDSDNILTSGTVTTSRVTGLNNPISSTDAVNRFYIDNFKYKDSVRVATTGIILVDGLQTVDGVSLSSGDRILVKNQIDPIENGIYVVSSIAWLRSSDLSTGLSAAGSVVTVLEGTTNNKYSFICTSSNGSDIVGTNELTFENVGLSIRDISVTDNTLARFDGTTGRIVQSSGVTIDDFDNIVTTGTITTPKVTGLNNPVNNSDAASKNYVDSAISNSVSYLEFKDSVRVATTGIILIDGLQTVDGISLSSGDRILVKNQIDPIENGIYVVSSSAWLRSSDLTTGSSASGSFVTVLEGTTNNKYSFICTSSSGSDIVGTNELTFENVGISGQYSVTNNSIVLYDGTTGKILKDSQVQINSGAVSGIASLSLKNPSTNTVTITPNVTTTNYSIVLPGVQGAAGSYIKNDGSGNLSWADTIIESSSSPSVNNSIVLYDGTGANLVKGSQVSINSGAVSGISSLSLKNPSTNTVTITPNVTTTNYSLVLPGVQGAVGSYIKNDGSGNLNWIDTVVETSTISTTDNTITRFDGTTGKIIQSTGVTIDDSDNMVTTGTITTPMVTGLNNPINSSDAASKGYVDANVVGGLDTYSIKQSVRVATNSNITLSGLQTIDGNVLSVDDRVLVKDQTNQVENGLYLVKSSAWVRTTDLSSGSSSSGVVVFVKDGVLNGKYIYICTNTVGSDIVDTNNIIFSNMGIKSIPSTNNSIVLYDGTTGKILKDSQVSINSGAVSGIASLSLENLSANTVTIEPSGTTTNYSLVLPGVQGSVGSYIKNDGSGNLSWADTVVETSATSTTDNTIVRFDGTTGKIIQSTGVTIDDSDNITTTGIITTPTVTGLNAPTLGVDATNKTYVDNNIESSLYNINLKDTVRVATTGIILVDGLQTVDGVSLSSGDRILVKNQIDPIENGIYVVSSIAWLRSSDLTTGSSASGSFVTVLEGTTNNKYSFICTSSSGSDIVGTNELTFENVGLVNTNTTVIDNTITRYDGTTGRLLQSSGVTIDDLDNITTTGTITATTVTGLNAPTNNLDATNKVYVDGIINNFTYKYTVRVATTGIILVDGLQTVDGVSLSSGDRILVKNQIDPIENGIYVVSSSAWLRSSDLTTGLSASGSFVTVLEGTTNNKYSFICTSSSGSDIVGTNELTFENVGISGVSSATNNSIVLYDGTTGKILKDSQVQINSGAVSGIASISLKNPSTNTVTITPNGTTTNYSLVLPGVQGSVGSYIKNDGSGNLNWIDTVVETSTTSTTDNGVVLYDGITGKLIKESQVQISSGAVSGIASLSFENPSTNTVTIIPNGTTTNYSLVLPGVQGSVGSYIKNDGSGNLSWIDTLVETSTTSTTDNGVVLYDGITGKLIKESQVQISSGEVSGIASLSFENPSANTVAITPNVTTTNYSLVLPGVQGAVGSYIKNDGSGNLSWIDTVVETSTTLVTDNTIVRYDGTTGKIIQSTGVTIDDSDNIITTGTITTPTVTGLNEPSNDTEASTKKYVDAISWKKRVRVASTGNITLPTPVSTIIDGISLVEGDRVLLKDQTTTSQNGIYVLTSGDFVRSGDFNTSINQQNTFVTVLKNNLIYRCIYFEAGVAITFQSFSANGDVIGPSSSTANGIPLYSNTTGKLLKNSGVLINNNTELSNVTSLTMSNGSNTITIAPNGTTTNYSLVLPGVQGAVGSYIKNDGSGNLSWIDTVVETSTTSTTDNTIVRYDGATGRTIQSTGVTIDDSDNIITTGTVTASTVTGLNAPTLGADATNKTYVDSLVSGLGNVSPVVVATTSNIVLSGTQIIDGFSLSINDRVLVKDQTVGSDNGVYLVQSSTWTRSSDYSLGYNVSGLGIVVVSGTSNSRYVYICTNSPGLDVVGTDNLVYDIISVKGSQSSVDNTVVLYSGTGGRTVKSTNLEVVDSSGLTMTYLTAGNDITIGTLGVSSGTAGSVNITAGSGISGSTTGGSVNITPGLRGGVGGTGGYINFNSSQEINANDNISFYFKDKVGSDLVQITGRSSTTDYNNGTSTTSGILRVLGGIGATGNIYGSTINASSDSRLKKDIVKIESAFDLIDGVSGYSYRWKDEEKNLGDKRSYGIIAQELETSGLGDLVTGEEVKSVNYNGLIPVLLECIKDLRKEVEYLKSKIE